MQSTDVTQRVLPEGKDQVTQAVLPEEGAGILRGEDKMRSGFVFTDSSIHPLPPGARELTVEGERTVVNVDFPAFAAAVPALPCLAGKSIGKGRPDMEKNFLRHKMHRVLS
jgi:hypothetical protein